ncbi:hypothetical protein FB45DRAFT_869595 [Roridomyces roridus]|uniref:Uncharacterized protein n=1 Tax=Roridomyces roridus TaxID=1738132 RepID=A0AAD7BM69_9AGAR|nr:hypothetical protein FB45DRAFT_869595 [Roridomyces roridus]
MQFNIKFASIIALAVTLVAATPVAEPRGSVNIVDTTLQVVAKRNDMPCTGESLAPFKASRFMPRQAPHPKSISNHPESRYSLSHLFEVRRQDVIEPVRDAVHSFIHGPGGRI